MEIKKEGLMSEEHLKISPLYNRFLHSFPERTIMAIEQGEGKSNYCLKYRSIAYKTIGSAKPISGLIISEHIKKDEK